MGESDLVGWEKRSSVVIAWRVRVTFLAGSARGWRSLSTKKVQSPYLAHFRWLMEAYHELARSVLLPTWFVVAARPSEFLGSRGGFQIRRSGCSFLGKKSGIRLR